MKRSEFKRQFMGEVKGLFYEHEVEMAARLAEDAGVQWDPEEPELPARVEVRGVPTGRQPSPYRLLTVPDESGSRFAGAEVVAEAAARYNAVGRFWSDYGAENNALMRRFQAIVREERERLH